MRSEIQRYTGGLSTMTSQPAGNGMGRWVHYSDHVADKAAAVKEVEAERDEAIRQRNGAGGRLLDLEEITKGNTLRANAIKAERVRLRECIEMILIPSLTAATGKPEYLGWWTDDIAIANLVLKETGDCKQALEEK